MPTSRNAYGIDIIVYNEQAKFKSIQVKTLSKKNPVSVGKSQETILGNFWIIVSNIDEGTPMVHILTKSEIQKLAEKKGKKGNESYWLQRKDYEKKKYRDAWHRIKA